MDNLINAIDKIVEGQVFKIVISNKKDKENKYNKININFKESKNKKYYQVEKYTDKQVFHENKEIEDLTLVREVSHFKPILENELSNLIYNALWFSPATEAIIAYIKETQKVVNGIAKVKLYKGHAQVVARQSANSLYDENLATYTSADSFDQDAAIGFIKLWGLPTQVNSQVNHPFDK